jgi:O-antigen ligase
MCSLPFLMSHHEYPLPTFYQEWLAIALGLAAVAAMLLVSPRAGLVIPRSGLWLLGFAAVLGLQVALDMVAYYEQSMMAVLYVIWAVMLIWLGSEMRRVFSLERICDVLAFTLIIGGMLNALFGVLQFFVDPRDLPTQISAMSTFAFGNINQSNLFANLLAMALGSLLFLVIRGRVSIVFAIFGAALLLFGLSLSASRSSWLYLVWFLVLAGLFARRSGDPRIRGIFLGMCGLVVLFIGVELVVNQSGFFVGVHGAATSTTARLVTQSEYSGNATPSLRWLMWRHAWMMFANAPLLGVGFGEFGWHYFLQVDLFAADVVSGQARQAHNIVLQLLSETGLLGTACVGLAVLGWAWRARKIAGGPAAWWLLALLGVQCIHSMLEFPLWYAHFLGPAALLMGLAETDGFHSALGAKLRAIVFGMSLMGALILGATLQNYVEFEKWFQNYLRIRRDDITSFLGYQDVLFKMDKVLLLRPHIELAMTGSVLPDRNHLADKLEYNGTAMRFAPIWPVAYKQVLLLALNGETEKAKLYLRHALLLYPGQAAPFLEALRSVSAEIPGAFPELEQIARGNINGKKP